jgi:hypothetical protein
MHQLVNKTLTNLNLFQNVNFDACHKVDKIKFGN